MSKNWSGDYIEGKGKYAIVQWGYNVGVALSQVLSAILGGDPDETICSRVGRAEKAGKKWAIKYASPFLDFLLGEEGHTKLSVEHDEAFKKEMWDWTK